MTKIMAPISCGRVNPLPVSLLIVGLRFYRGE
jgi:hypothetical protein